MPTKTFGTESVDVNEEGFLINYKDWNENMAKEIALSEQITLTPRHFEIIHYLRSEFEKKGEAPSIRRLKNEGIVDTKEFYALFPDGPLKKAAKISGIPKPKSCL